MRKVRGREIFNYLLNLVFNAFTDWLCSGKTIINPATARGYLLSISPSWAIQTVDGVAHISHPNYMKGVKGYNDRTCREILKVICFDDAEITQLFLYSVQGCQFSLHPFCKWIPEVWREEYFLHLKRFSRSDMLGRQTTGVWSNIFTQNPHLWLWLDLDAATAVQLFSAETFKSAHKFLSFAKQTIND